MSEELKVAVLEGQVALLEDEVAKLSEQVGFFAAEQDYWRRKYLAEHPDMDNWDRVETARRDEEAP